MLKPFQRMGLLVAVGALAADQISKNVLLYGYGFRGRQPFDTVEVFPFLELQMVWNRGVSYGLLQADTFLERLLLTIFSFAAVGLLTWWLMFAERRFLAFGLGLVVGGALGNVIDRMLYGAVADFFHFYAWGRDWYVFNVADAAITIGVVMLLVDTFLRPEAKTESDVQSTRAREPVIRE